jgi:ribonuclease E
MERDRARTKVLRMSQFGMIEMTRQRIRPSLKRSLYRECPMCSGFGHIKSVESMSIECMRILAYVAQREGVRRIQLVVNQDAATHMQNFKRRDLLAIEERTDAVINITAKEMKSPEDIELFCYDAYGDLLDNNIVPSPPPAQIGRRR